MKVASSRFQRVLALLMLAASLAYLVPFVPRGWVPHDEGMLGQSAERVMRGELPHVDYQEPYTGGLSWLYAATFHVSGVDLLHIRWLLFAGAAAATLLTYSILRRFLRPIGAALGTWVALAWSFPNWFSGLPSWWLLMCALTCLWGAIRHIETERIGGLALAGFAAGVAMAFKQTGAYLFIALLLFISFESRKAIVPGWRYGRTEAVVRWTLALTSTLLAAAILAPRMFAAEGVYLFCPIAACSAALLFPPPRGDASPAMALLVKRLGIAAAAAISPLAVLLVPYLLHQHLQDFLYGAFVLPRKRLIFASLPMPLAGAIVSGIPLLGLVVPLPRSIVGARSRFFEVLIWIAAVALPLLALRSLTAYQFIWQSTRALAALLPLAVCWQLAKNSIGDDKQKRILFLTASVLAWVSLNQYPWAAPHYFCYVAPLAVITGVALSRATSCLRPAFVVPWTLMVLLFAVLSPHRSYLQAVGVIHYPRSLDAPLDLPRAHLTVSAADAIQYRQLVATVQRHIGTGALVAGPDCPDVYFLLGLFSGSGRLFDFFADDPAHLSRGDLSEWLQADVVVVNLKPQFSPTPSDALLAGLRREFPEGQSIGKFEVRWR